MVTKAVLFLHENGPAHRTLATQKKPAYLGFHVLITHPTLQTWPRQTTTCSLDWKNNGRHFSSNAEVIAAAETWLDAQISEFFLSGLQKL